MRKYLALLLALAICGAGFSSCSEKLSNGNGESGTDPAPDNDEIRIYCYNCMGFGDCPTCDGTGKGCPTCEGTGTYCIRCNGSGECSGCKGHGECSICEGGGKKQCYTCRGVGLCTTCNGAGKNYYYGQWVTCTWCSGRGKCPTCSGSGKLNCDYCHGSGKCQDCYGTRICTVCHGVPTCATCGGDGHCPDCHNSDGKCTECSGAGYFPGDIRAFCPDGKHPHRIHMGDGTYWSCCNVGAQKPNGVGNHFAWGETEPKQSYSWSNYKWCDGTNSFMTKYCRDEESGNLDNKLILEAEDDAATANWGNDWRMPNFEEFRYLYNSCEWDLASYGNVKGFRVKSPEGKCIFLPITGYYNADGYEYPDYYGEYWTSTCKYSYPGYAEFLSINAYFYVDFSRTRARYCGLAVRPVANL